MKVKTVVATAVTVLGLIWMGEVKGQENLEEEASWAPKPIKPSQWMPPHKPHTKLAELKTKLQSAESNFQEKFEEVDAQLQFVAKEWDTAVDANADSAVREKIFARMNDLLNRRAYIRNLVASVEKELAA